MMAVREPCYLICVSLNLQKHIFNKVQHLLNLTIIKEQCCPAPAPVYVRLRIPPPLDSETGWTGDFWSNCVFLILENIRGHHFYFHMRPCKIWASYGGCCVEKNQKIY